jgi:hypothetical protein
MRTSLGPLARPSGIAGTSGVVGEIRVDRIERSYGLVAEAGPPGIPDNAIVAGWRGCVDRKRHDRGAGNGGCTQGRSRRRERLSRVLSRRSWTASGSIP